jgi:hypothetical protein
MNSRKRGASVLDANRGSFFGTANRGSFFGTANRGLILAEGNACARKPVFQHVEVIANTAVL